MTSYPPPLGRLIQELSKLPGIGEKTAEEIKIKIGSAVQLQEEVEIEIKGRDFVSGLPKAVVIKTNEIVKLLTIFSVIVFPLTLLAAIFGMNTKYLPLVGMDGDFWIITAIMIIGVVLMVWLFKKRRWI